MKKNKRGSRLAYFVILIFYGYLLHSIGRSDPLSHVWVNNSISKQPIDTAILLLMTRTLMELMLWLNIWSKYARFYDHQILYFVCRKAKTLSLIYTFLCKMLPDVLIYSLLHFAGAAFYSLTSGRIVWGNLLLFVPLRAAQIYLEMNVMTLLYMSGIKKKTTAVFTIVYIGAIMLLGAFAFECNLLSGSILLVSGNILAVLALNYCLERREYI